jgi:hypothetical protein
MTKEEISALLGRPLNSFETDNFETYFDIAEEALTDLICTPIDDVSETRTFYVRKGYSTAFTDIFWGLTKVEIDGEEVATDTYAKMQWDKFNASWYNSLVFDDKFSTNTKIDVTADWGFEASSDASSIPSDLQLVLAGLFGLITKKNKFDSSVQTKQVEDFRITFNVDSDLDNEFYDQYSRIINKYSLCNIPNVQHGDINCGC